MKEKIFVFIKKHWFMLFCCILLLFYFINICVQLDSKQQYTYTKSKLEKQAKELYLGSSVKFSMTPIADKMLSYDINLKDNYEEGQIAYSISNAQGNALLFGDYQLKNGDAKIAIDVSGCELKKGEQYFIALQLTNINKICVIVDNNNELYSSMTYEFTNGDTFMFIFILIFILFILVFAAVFHIESIYKKFIFLSMTLGFIFLFIIPPCTVPDELRHFARAYDITEGNIVCKSFATKEEFYNLTLTTCKIPEELFEIKMISHENAEVYDQEINSKIVYERWKDVMSKKIGNTDVEIPIQGTSSISPLAYLPQSIFIFLAKIFCPYVGIIFYLSKFGNLLIATLLGALALYITPKFKKGIFVLWFIPTLVYLRSSCSTDGFLFALIILLLAIFIRIYEQEKIDKKYIAAIFAIVFMIAQIKVPYVLCTFVFLLCKKKGAHKLKWIVSIGSFFVGYLSYRIFGLISALDTGAASTLGVKEYIYSWIQHPLYNIDLLFNAFVDDSWEYIKSALECKGFEILGIGALICILLTMRYCSDIVTDTLKCRVALIGGSIFIWACIVGIFALTSFKLGYKYVWGIQGRYMLPIFPFLFMGIASNNEKIEKRESLYLNIQLAIITIIFIYAYKLFALHWI